MEKMSQPSAISNRLREWELLLDSLSSQILNTFDASDEYEAITQLYKVNGIREIFGKWLLDLAEESQLDKSKVLSLAWRNKGNGFFKEGRLKDCLKYYNFSVLAAPRGHETFPLALANRAAVLLKMAKYKDSVRDSEMALQNGYPQDHRAAKLLLRIQEAQKHLSNAGEVQNFTESILRMLPGPNPALLGASSSLDLKYSSDRGRYVVTNRDVAAGEILFVEKPFAFVALPPPNKVLPTVCEGCCQPDITPIPCNSCAGSVYCSEECRALAWENFHRWECAGTRSLLWPTIGIAHLALRSFLVASREGFVLEGSEEQPKRKGKRSTQEALTSMREVCQLSTTPSGYGGIYNLVTNFDKMHKKDFLQYALTSIMLSTYLSEHTSLLGVGDIEEIKLAACRLLRLLGQLVSSGHAVGDTRMATALYPSASMMNHACAPNIVSSHYKDLLIVKALGPMRCGQEVLNCYGPHYRRMPGAQRRSELLQQYCFHCQCSACSDPKLDNFGNLFESYLCPECGGPVCKEAFKCEDCGKIPQNKEEIQQIGRKSLQLYAEAFNVGRMAKDILKVQNFQQKYFYKYNINLRNTNDFLFQLYVVEGSYDKSIQVMQNNLLPAAKLQFGDRSIEVANELERLSDVMVLQIKDCGENENISPQILKELCTTAKQTISEALHIFETFNGPWVSSFKELTEKMCFVDEMLKACIGH